MSRLVLFACLVGAVLCLPTGYSGEDPEYKPRFDPTRAVADDSVDEEALITSPVKEVLDKTPAAVYRAQIGSLVQVGQASVNDTEFPEMNSPPAPQPASQNETVVQEEPQLNKLITPDVKPNTQPAVAVERDGAVAYDKASSEGIAAVPVEDPAKKNVYGVNPPPVILDRPEDRHSMEAKTPLVDNLPCDPDRTLVVNIPSAEDNSNPTMPKFLAQRYGCSSEDDGSREKASPEITWTNIYEDVFEFSLQMIDMGDNCEARQEDETYGRIQWHITGMKAEGSVMTLKEGASHDSRMIFGGAEQPNQWLEDYYSGPCPARGTTGCYRVKILGHRATGTCQCGHQDVLFVRPEKPVAWVMQNTTIAPIGVKASQ